MERPREGREPREAITSDPLIDEVRAARKQLCEQFGNDIFKLGAHLRKLQDQHGEPVIRRLPPAPTTVDSF